MADVSRASTEKGLAGRLVTLTTAAEIVRATLPPTPVSAVMPLAPEARGALALGADFRRSELKFSFARVRLLILPLPWPALGAAEPARTPAVVPGAAALARTPAGEPGTVEPARTPVDEPDATAFVRTPAAPAPPRIAAPLAASTTRASAAARIASNPRFGAQRCRCE